MWCRSAVSIPYSSIKSINVVLRNLPVAVSIPYSSIIVKKKWFANCTTKLRSDSSSSFGVVFGNNIQALKFQALGTGCFKHLKLGVSGTWNWVFQALELGVSGLGTGCFRPWNWVFQALKLLGREAGEFSMHTLSGRTASPSPTCRKIFRKPFLFGYKREIVHVHRPAKKVSIPYSSIKRNHAQRQTPVLQTGLNSI